MTTPNLVHLLSTFCPQEEQIGLLTGLIGDALLGSRIRHWAPSYVCGEMLFRGLNQTIHMTMLCLKPSWLSKYAQEEVGRHLGGPEADVSGLQGVHLVV